MSSAPDETVAAVVDADVLVLGASFAGVEVVYQLHRRSPARPPTVIVVDRDRTHGYLPLVQERLLGTIPPETTALRTADYVESLPGARFVQGDVVSIDPRARTAVLGDGTRLRARILVIALGSVLEAPPTIVGGERLLAHKSPAQFEALRAALGRALGEGQPAPRIVVVGGGISGVELAGELAALCGRGQRPWPVAPAVTLVGGQPQLVPILGANVGARAKRLLEGQGVDVRVATRLVEVGDGWVDVGAADARTRIHCALAVWVGGIAPAPMLAALAVDHTSDGWIAVGPTLQCFPACPEQQGVFACGDAVRVIGGEGRWPTMQRAIECLWQAKVVATNILTLLGTALGDEAPPLVPHALRRRFAYGVSLGARSLVVWGPLCMGMPWINHGFRRWLMRQYFARYRPLPSAHAEAHPR